MNFLFASSYTVHTEGTIYGRVIVPCNGPTAVGLYKFRGQSVEKLRGVFWYFDHFSDWRPDGFVGLFVGFFEIPRLFVLSVTCWFLHT